MAALDPRPNDRVLDLCAVRTIPVLMHTGRQAPGGKSLLIAGALLTEKSILSRLVAVDASSARCQRLYQTLKSHFPAESPIKVVNCNPLLNKRALGKRSSVARSIFFQQIMAHFLKSWSTLLVLVIDTNWNPAAMNYLIGYLVSC